MYEYVQCDYRSSQRPKIEVHKVMKHSDRKDFKCNLCDYKGAIVKHLRRPIDAVNAFVPHPGL